MRKLFYLLALLPGLAMAAGSGGDTGTGTTATPPKPTNTTKQCKGVRVWDEAKGRCVRPKNSSLDDDALMQAVRELAHAGRIEDAQGVLRAMPDQGADLVLTYWGFTHRKLGQPALARAYYDRALAANPDNLLARSYLGQGHVETGEIPAALAQWEEIRARGGTGSWAELSLRQAIRTGVTYSY